MRLFRRRDEVAGTPDPEGPASAAPVTTEEDAGVARQPKQPTGDWMTMAPLAPSFQAMPTTFRVQTLPEILSSHTDTRVGGGSLGHAVSAEGPSGSVGGLATHSGDVSRADGMGELPLREPHHTPAGDEPAIDVRRLADPSPATSTAPTAGPISTASSASTPVVSRLPEPAVSRSLRDTAPLVAPRPSERPLPVARVVDAPAASSAPAASAAMPQPAPAFDASDASEPIDNRVGGFGVPLDGGDPIVFDQPVDDNAPRMAAPPELAPPIQSRRIQRALDPSISRPDHADAPLVGAAPTATSGGDLPITDPNPTPAPRGGELPLVAPSSTAPAVLPVSRLADPGASSRSSSDSTSSSTSGGFGPGTDSGDSTPGAAASVGSSGGSGSGAGRGASAGSAASAGSESSSRSGPSADGGQFPDGGSSTADDAASAAPDALQTTPLVGATPSITASAPIGDAPPTDASPAPGELTLHAPVPASSPSDLVLEAPIQRLADTATSPTATAPEGTAGLVGDAPLGESSSDADGDAGATEDDDNTSTPTPALPLVDPVRHTAPTIGQDPIVHVQSLAEGAGAPSAAPSPGTAGLPLAPSSDRGGALTPPAPRTAPAVERLPEARAGTSTRPLVMPAAPSLSSASAPSLQRSVATTASASTGTLPFVRPVGASRSIAERSGPMAMLSAPATAGGAAPLPVQLRRLDDAEDLPAGTLGDPARGDGGSAALPLAPLQRLDAGSPAGAVPSRGSSNGSAPSSDLPLHTPAASIPSAADIAVRAGLAERGPDGALFSTAAPAASYVVQRQAEGGAEVDAPVQRIVMGGHRAAAAGPAHAAVLGGGAAGPAAGDGDAGGEAGGDDGGGDGGGGGNDAAADAKDLSAEAKKLYPFIRSALEADIRRQIEGKSRASRFRP